MGSDCGARGFRYLRSEVHI